MKQRRPNHASAMTACVSMLLLGVIGDANSARAQGFINFSTRVVGTVVAHVYGVGDATQRTGNTVAETPAGVQVYSGALLTGTGFSAQLYGGPLGTLENSLVAIGPPSAFRTGSLAGTPAPQVMVVPSVPPGGTGTFQVRAWDNAVGTITSYGAAVVRGKSILFTVSNLGDGILTLPADMLNFRSFNIYNNLTDVAGGAPLAFALENVRPNPSRGERLSVAFTLPTSAPARLELLDVIGRRVATLDVGALGAGRHAVDLARGRARAPGLYLVRLTQGVDVRVTRVALLD